MAEELLGQEAGWWGNALEYRRNKKGYIMKLKKSWPRDEGTGLQVFQYRLCGFEEVAFPL